jgi:hypothetical protein
MKAINSNPFNNRRSFLQRGLAAGAAIAGAGALSDGRLLAEGTARLTKGDVAVLRFVAAAELIEAPCHFLTVHGVGYRFIGDSKNGGSGAKELPARAARIMCD